MIDQTKNPHALRTGLHKLAGWVRAHIITIVDVLTFGPVVIVLILRGLA